MEDLDQFRLRLAETIAWCSRQLEYYGKPDSWGRFNGLRDPRLRPPALGSFQDKSDSHGPMVHHNIKTPEEINRIVEHLAEQRALSLKQHNVSCTPASGLAGGRLLFYYPYENLADGFSEIESEGFFNAENEPPWDTWVAFARNDPAEPQYGCIVSWVPREMIDRAQAGVQVNPEECILWRLYLKGAFARQLRAAGLLV